MRYSVNYFSPFFTTDREGANTHYFSTYEAARELFYDVVRAGFSDAYLKDEEYQCSMHWDEKKKEFYWDT